VRIERVEGYECTAFINSLESQGQAASDVNLAWKLGVRGPGLKTGKSWVLKVQQMEAR